MWMCIANKGLIEPSLLFIYQSNFNIRYSLQPTKRNKHQFAGPIHSHVAEITVIRRKYVTNVGACITYSALNDIQYADRIESIVTIVRTQYDFGVLELGTQWK